MPTPRLRDEVRKLKDAGGVRVTVVRSGALGDTILVLPALSLIAQPLDCQRLTLVGSPWARRLMPLMPHALTFAAFDSPQMARLFAPAAHEDSTALFADAHLVVLYTSEPGGTFARNVRSLCAGAVIEWPVFPPPAVHAACHFAAALTEDTPSLSDIPLPSLRIEEDRRGRAARWLSANAPASRHGVVIVHPGSGGQRKCWPAPMFARLADDLACAGAQVLVLKGPADAEACSAMLEGLHQHPAPPVAELEDVADVAALISCAGALVGNDSGITHLAAAVGTPTVAVFGPTDAALWRPLGPSVTLVQGTRTKDNPSAWPAVEDILSAVSAHVRLART